MKWLKLSTGEYVNLDAALYVRERPDLARDGHRRAIWLLQDGGADGGPVAYDDDADAIIAAIEASMMGIVVRYST
jgi:hypothetical protein